MFRKQDFKKVDLLGSGKKNTTIYRGLTMRANYLAMDRADLQYSCKELARAMQKPNESDWQRLKRLGRYIKQFPRVVQVFHEQSYVHDCLARTDTDFAGCKRTRKSTTSVHRAWSRPQNHHGISYST